MQACDSETEALSTSDFRAHGWHDVRIGIAQGSEMVRWSCFVAQAYEAFKSYQSMPESIASLRVPTEPHSPGTDAGFLVKTGRSCEAERGWYQGTRRRRLGRRCLGCPLARSCKRATCCCYTLSDFQAYEQNRHWLNCRCLLSINVERAQVKGGVTRHCSLLESGFGNEQGWDNHSPLYISLLRPRYWRIGRCLQKIWGTFCEAKAQGSPRAANADATTCQTSRRKESHPSRSVE